MPRGRGKDFPESWDPRKGDQLVGRVTRHQRIKTKFGKTGLIEVKDRDGELTSVWCGNVALKVLFNETEEGDKIAVTFVEKEKGEYGRKIYELEVNGEIIDWEDDDDDDDDDDGDDDE